MSSSANPPDPTDPVLARLREALSERYTVERELGRGGMGAVYLATDLRHDRPVAIKVLRPESAHALGTALFLREIRTAAKLTHPHVLPIHDSGEAAGLLYFTMPFVEDESLRERLRRQERLPVEEAVAMDSTFASAYRLLGVAYGNQGGKRALQIEMFRRGMRHLDHLTEAERYLLSGDYYRAIGDVERSMASYRNLLSIRPNHSVALFQMADLPLPDRPYEELAWLYADAGRPAEAAAVLESFRAAQDSTERRMTPLEERSMRAAVALAEGRAADAVAELSAIGPRYCTLCYLVEIGRAHEAAGEPDAARAAYERYLATPFLDRLDYDAVRLSFVHARLARLAERSGEGAAAACHHQRLLDLWSEAEPEMAGRVAASRRALAALRRSVTGDPCAGVPALSSIPAR